MIAVKRYTPRKRHGGVMCHHTLELQEDGSQRVYLSRCFTCPCGEPLKDGDRVYDSYNDGRTYHVNCVDLEG